MQDESGNDNTEENIDLGWKEMPERSGSGEEIDNDAAENEMAWFMVDME